MSLLQRAADLDSSAPGIWSDLALAALAEGDRKAAEGYENQALPANPNDQIAWIVDAELAAQKSDWEPAIMRLNAVAEHSPSMLNQAVKWWPQGLQPQPSAAIAGQWQDFFPACATKRSPAILACVQRLYREALQLSTANKGGSNWRNFRRPKLARPKPGFNVA